ncbi:ABC-2 type transport system ATP-binding protein [Lachnospiraceae bacterium C7]|nr:ABC-2 type transport system ATP-binding protein [Lachnospiraceae bacterium C7]
MQNVLITSGLTKIYRGVPVVNGVNMTIKQGDIYGFIGKNGSGKTTFMRTILGMTVQERGSYQFFDGVPVEEARKMVGSLIEYPALYKNETVYENMKRFSILFGSNSEQEIFELLGFVGLLEAKKMKAKNLSLGMKQRLGIAIALIGNPSFLVLDEPINGLDPAGIKEIRDVILRLNKELNITFLISSHLLDELSKIATRFGLIDRGVLVEEFTAEELNRINNTRLELVVSDIDRALKLLNERIPANEIYVNEGKIILPNFSSQSGAINRYLVENGVDIFEMARPRESLEQHFIERVGR